MSYTSANTHYHPCELQHHLPSTTTSLYQSTLSLAYADEDQEDHPCTTPQPLAHTTDSDSHDSDTDSTTSSSSSRKPKKHSKKKNRRSHSSSTSSSRPSSFMVPENVKKQGDLAIQDLLNRLQKRQDSFAMLSTTHYDHEGVYGAHDDDDDDDGDNGEEDEEGEMRVTVHHQGLAPELLRETLGPHGMRQHHGNANLRHG